MSYLANKLGDANNLGYFLTPTDLTNAYPIGIAGVYAIVQSTGTIWIWNAGSNMWEDSGASGSAAFVYIAYASDAIGTGFTLTFNPALDYIAIKSTTYAIPSPVVGDFAGLWKNYAGVDGASFIWKGAYSGATAYVVNDVVFYGGSSYVCILASTGNAPTDGTYWNLMAQKGADGVGAGDVVGPAGAVDGNLVAFDTNTGKLIKDSGKKASDFQENLECVYKTANYTANPFELVNCDISAASFKVTLPSAPADKTVIYVKLNVLGTGNYLTIATSGTDKFNTPTGTVEIYMYLFGEYAQLQYCSVTGLWSTFISAGTYNFANQNPGVDATTPITNADISIDTSTRVLTIVPPLGYFNIFSDGSGIVTRYRKVGTINFPAFTDTSGTWYFYFDASGNAVTTQTPWGADDFASIITIYRIVWNATLSGSAKLVAQYVEYHQNTISADDHKWKHLYGAIWQMGFDIKTNAINTGTPNADGRNTVIALTTGTNLDDNLEYTVTNDSTPTNPWEQDMGDIVPATLNGTNGGQFKTFVQNAGGLLSFLPATRFPFAWDTGTNRPEYITSTGVRTLVPGGDYFVYFVYGTQNPVAGDAIKIVSAPASYGNITNARAVTWTDIQNTYPTLGTDGEIRPMYKLIFLCNTAWDDATKNARLHETQDIRKGSVTSTSTATGSLPASSVTVVPAGGIASTNAQSALEELDTEKAALAGATFTGNISAPNVILGFRTQATAAGTTTLTISDAEQQEFTGTTTQTVVLPTTSVPAGFNSCIINSSTGAVTVQSSGLNTIVVIAAGYTAYLTSKIATPTTAANWSFNVAPISAATTAILVGGGATNSPVWTTATGSGAPVRGTTPTLATPVINGLPTGTGVASASTASTLVARDANKNIAINNSIADYTTTATAAGTTTLTVGSTYQQFFTGTTTQIVQLPVTSTLTLGHTYYIENNSTGAVTVNSSGANAIVVLAGGTNAEFTCILTSGTTAASWAYKYSGYAIASGKKFSANNTLTVTGTDGTTMTFPSTSATIARTDSAQTFTGVQTMTSPVLSGKVVMSATDPTGATYTPASGSQTVALDCATNNMHIVTGNASGTAITFTVANATNNQPFIVSILQGGTTVSTIAGWFATVRWAGGTAPTLTATLNKRDTFGFIRTGANTYDGFVIGQNC
jgi:hypothetical protein